jgi:hypothetical protein
MATGPNFQNPVDDYFRRLALTFPNCGNVPTLVSQVGFVELATLLVALELGIPKFLSAFWMICDLAIFMSVPKATLDEYRFLERRKCKVKRTGKVPAVQPKAVVKTVHNPAVSQLWLLVCRLARSPTWPLIGTSFVDLTASKTSIGVDLSSSAGFLQGAW